MAYVSKIKDKSGNSYDISAKKMNGTRKIQLTGAVIGEVSTDFNGTNPIITLDTTIGDNAIQTSDIVDGAVTTSKINDKAVTKNKLSADLVRDIESRVNNVSYDSAGKKLKQTIGYTTTDVMEVYSKSDVDTELAKKADKDDTYTKSEVDDAISAATGGGSVVNDVKYEGGKLKQTKGQTTTDVVDLDGIFAKTSSVDSELAKKKNKQGAKPSPTVSGSALAFIDSLSQNEDGEVTATKKTVLVNNTYDATSENPISGKGVSKALVSSNGYTVKTSVESNPTKSWIKVCSVSKVITTGNINITSDVVLNGTTAAKRGRYNVSVRVQKGTPVFHSHTYVFDVNDINGYNIRPFVTITNDSSTNEFTVDLYTFFEGNTQYSSLMYENLFAMDYDGKILQIDTSDNKKVKIEPSGNLVQYAEYVANAYIKNPRDVGSSSVPVYVNLNGIIIACKTEDLKAGKDGDGNVISTTYAKNSDISKLNTLKSTLLTDADDLNTVIGSDSGVYYYRWASTSVPGNAPVINSSVMEVIRTHISTQKYCVQNVYPSAVTDKYYSRVLSNATWSQWKEVYYAATSTYSPTSIQPVNGKCVANALESYVPKTMIKSSSNVASMDSDDANAYTGKAISQKITDAMSGSIGGWLGNRSVSEINAISSSSLKSGDYATITDNGTITLGNVTVMAGDEIYFVPSESIWQKKDNSTYVKRTDIAKSNAVGVVKSSNADGNVKVAFGGEMSVNGWGTLAGRVTTAETNITTLQGTTSQHTSDISAINTTISNLDLDRQGGDGKYIKSVTQSNGQVTVEVADLDTDVSNGGERAPTTDAVKTYVDSAVSTAVSQETSERIASVQHTYSPTSEQPISGKGVSVAISNKANSSDVYTKAEVDTLSWDCEYDPDDECLTFSNLVFKDKSTK